MDSGHWVPEDQIPEPAAAELQAHRSGQEVDWRAGGKLVVFVGAARLPKGMPCNVVTLRRLTPYLKALGLPDERDQRKVAWQWLREAAERGRSMFSANRGDLSQEPT